MRKNWARVFDVHPEEGCIWVHFLELGHYELAFEAFEMPRLMRYHPPVALECGLNKVQPADGFMWTEKTSDLMTELCIKYQCFLKIENMEGVTV